VRQRRTASLIGVLVVVALFAAPLVITWVADESTARDVVDDAIGSTQLPMILFGLGAVGLAANPDGVLARGGEQLRAQRLARDRVREAAGVPPPATPATLAAPVPVPAPVAVAGDGPPPLLRAAGLVAGYGEVEVLHGVDLDVPPGRIVALLGANGAGKSTLCNVVGGLLAPWRGRLFLDGHDVTGLRAFERARAGLLLAPEARGIFPGLSVEENLDVWLRDAGERERAYERFPILAQRRRQPAGLLSGGEQQMLALASALERPPRVLVVDEPSLGLAPLAVEAVFRTLVELRDRGVALLLVEEKSREVLGVADTIVLMALGRVRWAGAPSETDADRLAAAYLGT
jgi:ABC-type branched-subunit amino acid transport system ATPase component